ncbi:MAG: VOC family protein [Acidimicrobiaceae bacterium]|nr:VOC family protein [Acidimicrobiaceae bacterium]
MRLQLALNVSDLDAAVDFYTRMFGTAPARRRPGYANFAIDEPPLKLVLFETAADASDPAGCCGAGGTINHLGVEAETAEQVVEAERRLTGAGLDTTGVDDTMCCYAAKTETWLTDPDGSRWEWYVRTGDSEVLANMVVASR